MAEVASNWAPPYIHPYFANRVELVPLGCFSVLLGIFVDYVIITQSKMLGSFKYFVLNQTIWAQFLEIIMLIFNPVFLSPYIAGYMEGILHNVASYECSVVATTLSFIVYVNTAIGVTVSLVNRYIFTFFPQYRPLLENKITIICLVLFQLAVHSVTIFLFVSTASDADTNRNYAKKETHTALEQYYLQPGFIYLSEYGTVTRSLNKFMFGGLVVISSILAASVILFIKNVIKQKKTSIISKTAKSLIVSSIMQAILCICMLYTPMLLILGTWGFNIRNSSNIVNIFVTLLSIHGTFDMVSTLYFIIPYRKYCKNLLTCARKITIVTSSSQPHA
uniref:Serpentine Receptor, class T n=1 Tax=Panagrellus redivivus TaxID=6233 RepID=A0A7E5A1P3_PANRE